MLTLCSNTNYEQYLAGFHQLWTLLLQKHPRHNHLPPRYAKPFKVYSIIIWSHGIFHMIMHLISHLTPKWQSSERTKNGKLRTFQNLHTTLFYCDDYACLAWLVPLLWMTSYGEGISCANYELWISSCFNMVVHQEYPITSMITLVVIMSLHT